MSRTCTTIGIGALAVLMAIMLGCTKKEQSHTEEPNENIVFSGEDKKFALMWKYPAVTLYALIDERGGSREVASYPAPARPAMAFSLDGEQFGLVIRRQKSTRQKTARKKP
jgi:hypothetical protein